MPEQRRKVGELQSPAPTGERFLARGKEGIQISKHAHPRALRVLGPRVQSPVSTPQ